jgi:hypothetical protein
LVHVKLDLKNWHWLFKLDIMSAGTIDSLGDVFKDEVEIHLVFLIQKPSNNRVRGGLGDRELRERAYLFTVGIKE